MTGSPDKTGNLRPPALDPMAVEARIGSRYPEQFRPPVAGRERRVLGDAAGLRNFGVNLVRLPPGSASALRHWHSRQDEFVYVLEGEVVLVTDAGEQILGPGMAAGFPANSGDGHHLVNRSDGDALYLEVGDRSRGDEVNYPDLDLHALLDGTDVTFTRKDGTPY